MAGELLAAVAIGVLAVALLDDRANEPGLRAAAIVLALAVCAGAASSQALAASPGARGAIFSASFILVYLASRFYAFRYPKSGAGDALFALAFLAAVFAFTLVLFPLVFGWRTIFSRYPGKFGTLIYFLCLGLGYIIVEVGMIAHFILALSNATVSASVLITGMLVFSGIGAFVSERYFDRARTVMPRIFLAIFAILTLYAFGIDYALDWIGTLPYALRIVLCLRLLLPPAFLMGFPMPTAMTTLGRLGKDHMFLWAWGINGCFSVIGAAIVPIVATSFGLTAVLMVAGVAYLLAMPAFFAVLLPLKGRHAAATI